MRKPFNVWFHFNRQIHSFEISLYNSVLYMRNDRVCVCVVGLLLLFCTRCVRVYAIHWVFNYSYENSDAFAPSYNRQKCCELIVIFFPLRCSSHTTQKKKKKQICSDYVDEVWVIKCVYFWNHNTISHHETAYIRKEKKSIEDEREINTIRKQAKPESQTVQKFEIFA